MSFQIRPLREILVVPALPPALSRLPELGLNLLWSWNHSMRAVFRRLDPAAWKASNHNPVVMLGRVEQATFERAAADPRFLALYRRACEILDGYLQQRLDPDGWQQEHTPVNDFYSLPITPVNRPQSGEQSGGELLVSVDL